MPKQDTFFCLRGVGHDHPALMTANLVRKLAAANGRELRQMLKVYPSFTLTFTFGKKPILALTRLAVQSAVAVLLRP